MKSQTENITALADARMKKANVTPKLVSPLTMAFMETILGLMVADALSDKDLRKASGLSKKVRNRIREGGAIQLDDLAAIAAGLGVSIRTLIDMADERMRETV